MTGPDPIPSLERFATVTEPAADFLVAEVLTGLPAADRDLLAAIGVAEPVTGALAAVLSGRTDAEEMLDRLVRDSGLVVRGPGEQFRVHPLVAPHLRGEYSG